MCTAAVWCWALALPPNHAACLCATRCVVGVVQVGGFFFIHRDDLKRLSPLWLKYTEDVRADPEVRQQH